MSSITTYKYTLDMTAGSHLTFVMKENKVKVQTFEIKQNYNGERDCMELTTSNSFISIPLSLDLIHMCCRIVKMDNNYRMCIWSHNSNDYNWNINFVVDDLMGKVLFQWIKDFKDDANTTICQTFNKNEWKSIDLKDTEENIE